MLGSLANSSTSNSVQPLRGQLRSKAANETKRQDQVLYSLLEREWSELPYAMMRITAARRPWDGNRVYWRDNTVQLGELDLNLIKIPAPNDTPRYIALYTHEEHRREFTLHPSRHGDQLCWTVPAISDLSLTTDQLAEKLLSKLVTFYTAGLAKPSATSSASPTSPASPGPAS